MNAFTVLEKRGAVIDATSVGRAASRGADYDESRGPRGSRTGAPRDLAHSRRVGLSRTVCDECGGVKGEVMLSHEPGCESVGVRRRETTGPLRSASPIMRIFERKGQAWMTMEAAASTAAEAGWR
jgi:hypothetical protein